MSIPDPAFSGGFEAEISDCVRRVIGPSNERDCLQAATRLTELGVRTRRSILPRGSPDKPAPNRLPVPGRLLALIDRFKATEGETRRELVSALGEWGDGKAAVAIREFLQQSEDPPTQRTCINALMTIGGQDAIRGLSWAAKQEPLQRAALWALDELNTGGTLDYSEGTTVGQHGTIAGDSTTVGQKHSQTDTIAASPVPAQITRPVFGPVLAAFAAAGHAVLAQREPGRPVAAAVRLQEGAGESTSLTLLKRLREHPDSAEAWERLVAFYRPLLLRWVVRWGLQDAEAENLAQEVLLEVVRLLPGFQHSGRPGAFRLWLRNILTNRVREFLRRRRSHPWFFFSEWPRRAKARRLLDELETQDRPLNRLWDEEHDQHVVREIWSILEGKLLKGKVSERDVKAFRLVVEGTMKPADVAKHLGISVALVWQIKSRILRELREEARGLIDASPAD